MQFLTFYNGKTRDAGEPFISLSDRAVYFGDGIYDACIGRKGAVFMLGEHIARFMSNAKRLDIPVPYTERELSDLLIWATSGADGECFLYFQLTRYADNRAHDASDSKRSNFLLTASDIKLPKPDKLLSLIWREDTRHLICDIKTLNLIISCDAARAARKMGADEAVFIRDGIVTECAHSNIHIIKNGVLLTHPADRYILPGISRTHMLDVCRRLGIPYTERPFSEEELIQADEVLVSSTSKLCLRAERFENTVYKTYDGSIGAQICKTMRADFDNLTK